MGIFNKQNWLNFTVTLFGFTFFFSLSAWFSDKFYARAIITGPTFFHYPWLINDIFAFLLSLSIVFFFCKPRAPLFISAAVLLGGAFSIRSQFISPIIDLDNNLRQQGLTALGSLFPHLFLIILALIALYAAWLSNRKARGR